MEDKRHFLKVPVIGNFFSTGSTENHYLWQYIFVLVVFSFSLSCPCRRAVSCAASSACGLWRAFKMSVTSPFVCHISPWMVPCIHTSFPTCILSSVAASSLILSHALYWVPFLTFPSPSTMPSFSWFTNLNSLDSPCSLISFPLCSCIHIILYLWQFCLGFWFYLMSLIRYLLSFPTLFF